jgi:transposase-like protein
MNIIEITNKFPTELDVIQFFEKKRWKNKITCAFCGSTNLNKRSKDYRWHCKDCKKSFSVTTNTYLHNTRMPLKTWLYAFAIITDAKKGLSAKQLERNLGIHYESAWTMAHKIRDIMAIENRQLELDGIVEMDETYIGGKPRKFQEAKFGKPKPNAYLDGKIKNLKPDFIFKEGEYKKNAKMENSKRGRGTEKTPVAGIVERNGNVIAGVLKQTNYTNLKKLVTKYVDMDNSVLLTDEFKGYNRFDAVIEHVKIDHQKMYSYKGLNTNTIESFWAIIKRGIMGQYHSVDDKYLPKYIDEFVFKFNNRKKDDMFITLVKNSMQNLS